MPGFDKTGPQGQGPKTGKGMGPCGDGGARGFRCCGRGMGRGRYAGRAYLTKDEEVDDLKEYAKVLKDDLKAIEEKISKLEK